MSNLPNKNFFLLFLLIVTALFVTCCDQQTKEPSSSAPTSKGNKKNTPLGTLTNTTDGDNIYKDLLIVPGTKPNTKPKQ